MRPIIKVILWFISCKSKRIANNQNTTSHIFELLKNKKFPTLQILGKVNNRRK